MKTALERVPGAVMIVTATIDLGADRVVAKLRERSIPVFRLNTDHLPVEAQLTLSDAKSWSAAAGPYQVFIEDVSSVWFRKIRYRSCPQGVDPQVHAYVSRETYATLRAFLDAIPSNCAWMSPVSYIDRAELKPVQLACARQLGMLTPRTLISARAASIRDFVRAGSGPSVGKPVRSGYVRTSSGDFGIFTRRLDEEDLAALDDVLACPIIVQEEIPKKYDLRVTVVGDCLFAAAIDSQSDPDASVDWRRTSNPALPHYRHELPLHIAEQCLALMTRLGLAYGALDFALTDDERYVFLEVNPNGEWLWIEDQLEYPISDEIAAWLSGERKMAQ